MGVPYALIAWDFHEFMICCHFVASQLITDEHMLVELHWLQVHSETKFKAPVFTFKALYANLLVGLYSEVIFVPSKYVTEAPQEDLFIVLFHFFILILLHFKNIKKCWMKPAIPFCAPNAHR